LAITLHLAFLGNARTPEARFGFGSGLLAAVRFAFFRSSVSSMFFVFMIAFKPAYFVDQLLQPNAGKA